jgi:hypothetical protein
MAFRYGPGPTLDTNPGAYVAYSLRKINSTYNGSVIRVRRSSDNQTADIGFYRYSLDQKALLDFVGNGSGFVTTWYDQSGNNRHATQSTNLNQPRIVDSGSTVTLLNNPCLQNYSNQQFLLVPIGTISGENIFSYTISNVDEALGQATGFGTLHFGANPRFALRIRDLSNGTLWITVSDDNGNASDVLTSNFGPSIVNGGLVKAYTQGAQVGRGVNNNSYVLSNIANYTTRNYGSQQFYLLGGTSYPSRCRMVECIVYPNPPDEARLITQINGYYRLF